MNTMANQFWFVGDVHGRADLLATLLEGIAKEDQSPKIVFLGDLVDRGPASSECMDIVHRTLQTFPGSRLLLGNHDDMFLGAIRSGVDDKSARHWRDACGGSETLSSTDARRTYPKPAASSGLPTHIISACSKRPTFF